MEKTLQLNKPKNKIMIPFNNQCQTKGCDGNFFPIENYIKKEFQQNKNNPMIIDHIKNHCIIAYQCNKCGRIHGKYKNSKEEIEEFFVCSTTPLNFNTPSNIVDSSIVNKWTKV